MSKKDDAEKLRLLEAERLKEQVACFQLEKWKEKWGGLKERSEPRERKLGS
jgi:hypothetical protein